MKRFIAASILVALLSACGGLTGSSPSPASSPASNPSPLPSSGLVCGSVSGGSQAGSAVAAVRVGQHPAYDRFVIEFGGGVPAYQVTMQSSATFTRSPMGDQVTLDGTAGVLIVVHPITNWTSYTGPTELHPGYPYLRQAMLVENFEGYQQWGLGIQGSACVKVGILTSPNRLVVDVVP